MDIRVLNKNFEDITILDEYESFLWTERYDKCGDFELYTAIDKNILQIIKQDYYLSIADSDRLMIVEKIQITSDVENGNKLKVSGRSLESILDRRIVWRQMNMQGNFQTGISVLLRENATEPADQTRLIPNLKFQMNNEDRITKLKLRAQFTGDNLYEAIQKLCEEYKLGFKIVLDDRNRFVFSLYMGEDRSYAQSENSYIVFSPGFDNIINSNYMESRTAYKNVALVMGEGEGAERKRLAVGTATSTGLERRELYVDARDLSTKLENEKTMPEAEYMEKLKQRGLEKLSKCQDVVTFEGQVDAVRMYRYGRDFFIGDIVQIANEYGHETTARVIELVRSDNKDGFTVYPTFKTINDTVETT